MTGLTRHMGVRTFLLLMSLPTNAMHSDAKLVRRELVGELEWFNQNISDLLEAIVSLL